ncbi:MAG TPA: hypothetical protein PK997_02880 [Candidatus Omnitrophota bacterium]|jgi:hypothetical protein|nr:MAG: hypothetical protein BWY49_00702 [Candidatus Omnitrophica bacterium ADurb.Bin314]HOE69062.1 hypothetical protein [Candidatus Omnitrophota bacterium]HPW65079.1 hypothetical protein [Candidatus Omnitrophota bacterium]HQB94135.1 hypothetical protein [Candidatus Omnitrophota bacterium]
MKKFLSCILVLFLVTVFTVPSAFAAGGKEFGASLLLPTTGQTMNGQFGSTKTKLMAGIEVAAITATVILGFVPGGAIVWAGAGPLLANHLWSATDAFVTARKKDNDPYVQEQMLEAQRTLDVSRQNRFARESNIRQRILKAGEESY